MKNFLRNIVILYLSLFICCAGSGATLVYFCCIDCAEKGIHHVVSGECDKVHHHDHQHNASCHHHDHCRLLHYSIEDMSIDTNADLSHASVEHVCSFFIAAEDMSLCDILLQAQAHHLAPPLTASSGRLILALIQVLRL